MIKMEYCQIFKRVSSFYFFDPSKSQSDYDILFKQLLPNIRIVAHSPLYQLRSDMLFCMNNDKWLSAIITRNARLRKFAF